MGGASGTSSGNVTSTENMAGVTGEQIEQEAVALQEQEQAEEADADLDADDDIDRGELEKVDAEDEHNAHSKPVTASRENIEEIAPLIGDDWKKLGKKLGYTADEMLYFETEHPDRDGGCIAMLSTWFADDDDASLDNWAYMLEGLEINAAAKAVKALIERLATKEEKVEVLSD